MTTRREFLAGAAATVPLLLAPTGGRADEKKAAPKQVLVVNTQDESVSLVDLTTMKEVHTDHVGKRPYGIAVSRDGKMVAVGVEVEQNYYTSVVVVVDVLDGNTY